MRWRGRGGGLQETISLLIPGSGEIRENCGRVRRQSNAEKNVNEPQAASFSISAPVSCKGENHLLLLGFDFSNGENCDFLRPRFRFFAESRTPSGICHWMESDSPHPLPTFHYELLEYIQPNHHIGGIFDRVYWRTTFH